MKNKFSDKDYWNHYVGNIWRRVFEKLDLKKDGVVVEIAPGDVNKIDYGLQNFGFNGTLYVVDSNKTVAKSIVAQYKKILTRCEIIPVAHTVGSLPKYLNSDIEAIVANHPFDDILLGKFLTKTESEKHFSREYGVKPEKVKQYWQKMINDPEKLWRIKGEVVGEFVRLIQAARPNLVAISQYKSYYYQSHEIFNPDEQAFDVLRMFEAIYPNNRVRPKIKNITDMKRWMFLDFRESKALNMVKQSKKQ